MKRRGGITIIYIMKEAFMYEVVDEKWGNGRTAMMILCLGRNFLILINLFCGNCLKDTGNHNSIFSEHFKEIH